MRAPGPRRSKPKLLPWIVKNPKPRPLEGDDPQSARGGHARSPLRSSQPATVRPPCKIPLVVRTRDRPWSHDPREKGEVLRLVKARVVLESDGTLVGVTEVELEIEGRPGTFTLKGTPVAGARLVPGDELVT